MMRMIKVVLFRIHGYSMSSCNVHAPALSSGAVGLVPELMGEAIGRGNRLDVKSVLDAA